MIDLYEVVKCPSMVYRCIQDHVSRKQVFEYTRVISDHLAILEDAEQYILDDVRWSYPGEVSHLYSGDHYLVYSYPVCNTMFHIVVSSMFRIVIYIDHTIETQFKIS